nr:Rieske (2Fe-2S) protein [Pseudonocardia acidicola]
MLRAARPGAAAPREEFVGDLHRRLAAMPASGETDRPLPRPRPAVDSTRRRLVQATSIAAAAAAAGAVVDHTVTGRGPAPSAAGGDQTLTPNTGRWRTVSASADLAEGGVQGFDLGTVIGFVSRTGGRLRAVSGVCTHQGCRLALEAAARQLDCPCHSTAFAIDGQLVRHQLPMAPPPLPQLEVRELNGEVQVYAPPGPVA